MTKQENRIKIAIKFIKRYKKNIRFMRGRIKLQDANPTVRYSRMYYQFDIDLMTNKLNQVKKVLEEL